MLAERTWSKVQRMVFDGGQRAAQAGRASVVHWGDPLVDAVTSSDSFMLPAGTVTFLLTDIVSSTRLWELDVEAMQAAVTRYYEILDIAVSAHGGVRPLEQGEGDSVVAAFARASDAVLAALDAQLGLRAESWPTVEPVLVRMAVHTGEARLRDSNNYAGPAIIRTARLRSIAHGGQVVVSSATRDLTIDGLGDEMALADLGSHRLKDLGRPERVYQLVHPRLPARFPPLRSVDAVPNNLPTQLSTFIGRVAETLSVVELVEGNRLVTVTGSGGSGKSRLAQRVAVELL
jgi:class 3 adenylate cyclase